MSTFTIHTIDTAPEESKSLLQESLKQNGMIANLHGWQNPLSCISPTENSTTCSSPPRLMPKS